MVETAGAYSGRDFRPDIQGMRAIAVLLVLIFHVFPNTLPGGYVGVDVFFVISGFLITGILLRSAESQGGVSYLKFYERRARRLLPAASLALVASGVAAFFLLPETRWGNTGWEILASAAYFENFFLYFKSLDYLAADYAPSPFQHYWSLSIEEQFYIFWPIIIGLIAWLAHRRGRKATVTLGLAFGVVFAVSLAISIYSTPRDGGTYFLTQARAWELALGGLTALVRPHLTLSAALSSLVRWLALIGILAAGLLYTTQTAFPGYTALLPTVSSALLLLTAHSQRWWDPSVILSLPPMRYVGDISYSLYLWHWPVVVFAAVTLGETFTLVEGAVLIGISIALAHFSKFLVEDRFRERPTGTGGARSFIVCGLFVLASLLVAACLIIPGYWAKRQADILSLDFGNYPGAMVSLDPSLPVPDVPFIPSLQGAHQDNPQVYVMGCHVSQEALEPNPCRYGPEDAEHVIAITGDSHAAHWIPALRFLADERGYGIYTFTKSACPFITGAVERSGELYAECTEWNRNTLAALIALQPDLVVTGKFTSTHLRGDGGPGSNDERVVEGLAASWQALGDAGIPVLAIEHTPRMVSEIPECVATNPDNPETCGRTLSEATARYDPQVDAARLVDTAQTVNLNTVICGSEFCPPIVGNVLVYRDAHHLSATFSRTLGPALASRIVSILEGQTLDFVPSTAEREDIAVDRPVADTGFVPGDHPGAMVRIDPTLMPTLPVQMRPSPDSARGDFPDIFRTGCHTGRRAFEIVGCTLGPDSAGKTMMLVGDAQAAQWVPALLDIAATHDVRLLIRTRSGCPLIDADIYTPQGPDLTCRDNSEAVMAEIEALRPDLVLTSMEWNVLLNGHTGLQAQFEARETALVETWSRIAAQGIPILSIGAAPRFEYFPANCVEENDQDMDACALPRPQAVPESDPSRNAARQVNLARHAAFDDVICTQTICPIAMGNVFMYRDPSHLTATYVRSLAPVMAPVILDALDIDAAAAAEAEVE